VDNIVNVGEVPGLFAVTEDNWSLVRSSALMNRGMTAE